MMTEDDVGLLIDAFDHKDKRAWKLARTDDERTHAMMTAMLNSSRGMPGVDTGDDESLMRAMFPDGGVEYRARAARLRAAAERPRGEITDESIRATDAVLGNVDLVKNILEQMNRDERRLMGPIARLWRGAAAVHTAWAVMDAALHPEEYDGGPAYTQELLEIHATEAAARAAADARNMIEYGDAYAARGAVLQDDDYDFSSADDCYCGAVPVRLSWPIQHGEPCFYVTTSLIKPIDGLMLSLAPADRFLFRTHAEAERMVEQSIEQLRIGPPARSYRRCQVPGGAVKSLPRRFTIRVFNCGSGNAELDRKWHKQVRERQGIYSDDEDAE